MKQRHLIICILTFSMPVLLFINSKEANSGTKSLKGNAFSIFGEKQKMPADWINKRIIYSRKNHDADLVVTLNQRFYEFITPHIKTFAAKHGIKIVIGRGTCGISAGMLYKKNADIGAYCCPPSKTDRLPGIEFHTIGIHPISIIVDPENPINDIPLKTIRDIFQGNISRWSKLGWAGIPIQPVIRLHCKKRPGHWRLILDHLDLYAAEAREVGAIEDMFSLVSTIRGGIGYEVMWKSQRKKVKVIKINGMAPGNTENLLKLKYPFYRVFSITTWEQKHLKNSYSRKLVDYIMKKVEIHGPDEGFIPASGLRKSGWKFTGAELTGEPE